MNILVPAAVAVALVTGRAVTKHGRAPYPYELVSTAIVFAGCGLVGEANQTVGAVMGWGYVVALLLQPSSANLLNAISGGLANA